MTTHRWCVPFTLAVTALVGCTDEPTAPAEPPTHALHGVGHHIAASAVGAGRWTIPPEVFGVTVDNVLAFSAIELNNGAIHGHISYTQTVEGEAFRFQARVTCVAVYGDGTRAKYGGVVEQSNDATIPVGTFMWFQAIDNGKGPSAPADQSTIAGFGDEAANEAFCASDAPPVRIFDIEGAIHIR
jgi:hypothetical protein